MIVIFAFSVTMSRKPSASVQRQEWTPWLLPSERERRRPSTEQNEFGRMKTREDFGDRRTAKNEQSPLTSYTTSYSQHYNHINTPSNTSFN
jgi:hypothetical protein